MDKFKTKGLLKMLASPRARSNTSSQGAGGSGSCTPSRDADVEPSPKDIDSRAQSSNSKIWGKLWGARRSSSPRRSPDSPKAASTSASAASADDTLQLHITPAKPSGSQNDPAGDDTSDVADNDSWYSTPMQGGASQHDGSAAGAWEQTTLLLHQGPYPDGATPLGQKQGMADVLTPGFLADLGEAPRSPGSDCAPPEADMTTIALVPAEKLAAVPGIASSSPSRLVFPRPTERDAGSSSTSSAGAAEGARDARPDAATPAAGAGVAAVAAAVAAATAAAAAEEQVPAPLEPIGGAVDASGAAAAAAAAAAEPGAHDDAAGAAQAAPTDAVAGAEAAKMQGAAAPAGQVAVAEADEEALQAAAIEAGDVFLEVMEDEAEDAAAGGAAAVDAAADEAAAAPAARPATPAEQGQAAQPGLGAGGSAAAQSGGSPAAAGASPSAGVAVPCAGPGSPVQSSDAGAADAAVAGPEAAGKGHQPEDGPDSRPLGHAPGSTPGLVDAAAPADAAAEQDQEEQRLEQQQQQQDEKEDESLEATDKQQQQQQQPEVQGAGGSSEAGAQLVPAAGDGAFQPAACTPGSSVQDAVVDCTLQPPPEEGQEDGLRGAECAAGRGAADAAAAAGAVCGDDASQRVVEAAAEAAAEAKGEVAAPAGGAVDDAPPAAGLAAGAAQPVAAAAAEGGGGADLSGAAARGAADGEACAAHPVAEGSAGSADFAGSDLLGLAPPYDASTDSLLDADDNLLPCPSEEPQMMHLQAAAPEGARGRRGSGGGGGGAYAPVRESLPLFATSSVHDSQMVSGALLLDEDERLLAEGAAGEPGEELGGGGEAARAAAAGGPGAGGKAGLAGGLWSRMSRGLQGGAQRVAAASTPFVSSLAPVQEGGSPEDRVARSPSSAAASADAAACGSPAKDAAATPMLQPRALDGGLQAARSPGELSFGGSPLEARAPSVRGASATPVPVDAPPAAAGLEDFTLAIPSFTLQGATPTAGAAPAVDGDATQALMAGMGAGVVMDLAGSLTPSLLDATEASPSLVYGSRYPTTPFRSQLEALPMEAARHAPLVDNSPLALGGEETTISLEAQRALYHLEACGDATATAGAGGGGTGGLGMNDVYQQTLIKKLAEAEEALKEQQFDNEKLREQLCTLEFQKDEMSNQDEFEREAREFAEAQLAKARAELARLHAARAADQSDMVRLQEMLQQVQTEAEGRLQAKDGELLVVQEQLVQAQADFAAASDRLQAMEVQLMNSMTDTKGLAAEREQLQQERAHLLMCVEARDKDVADLLRDQQQQKVALEKAMEQLIAAQTAKEHAVRKANEERLKMGRTEAALAQSLQLQEACKQELQVMHQKYAIKSQKLEEAQTQISAQSAELAEVMGMCDTLLNEREAKKTAQSPPKHSD